MAVLGRQTLGETCSARALRAGSCSGLGTGQLSTALMMGNTMMYAGEGKAFPSAVASLMAAMLSITGCLSTIASPSPLPASRGKATSSGTAACLHERALVLHLWATEEAQDARQALLTRISADLASTTLSPAGRERWPGHGSPERQAGFAPEHRLHRRLLSLPPVHHQALISAIRSRNAAEAEAEALDALRSGSKRGSIPRASPEEAAQDLGTLPDAQV